MIGDYRHLVTFQDPGPALPDGVGGYTETWADLAPAGWYVSLNQPAAGDLERISGGGSVITAGSYLVRGRYHPDVSTKTRMLFSGRTFSITGTRNVDERAVTMELAVVEQIPSPVIGPPPALSYAAQVVADGAIHYWRLGESAGTVTIDSIGDAHGTISGGVTRGVPGAISDGTTAMTFNGTTGQIQIAAPLRLVPPFTVEAWIQTTQPAAMPVLTTNILPPYVEDTLVISVTTYLAGRVLHAGDTGQSLIGGTGRPVNDGAWHHLIWVFLGGTSMDAYVDSVIEPLSPDPPLVKPLVGNTLQPGAIAFGNWLGNYWNGTLDEIAIYPHALTPAQIAAHYTAASATTRRRR